MNLDELTIGQAKELAGMFGDNQSCGETLTKKGDKVFIRTLSWHYTGEVIRDTGVFLELKDCAWIADSGRFSTAISTGELNEVEPLKDGTKLMYSNIIDCIPWEHDLPKDKK